MNVNYIEETLACFLLSVSHLLEVEVEVPVIAALDSLPLGVSEAVSALASLNAGEHSPESRSEDLSLGVYFLDYLCKLDRLGNELVVCDLFGMHSRVSIVPESRLVIEGIALEACLCSGIAEGLYEVVDVFVHIYLVISEVGLERESAVLAEFYLVPAC